MAGRMTEDKMTEDKLASTVLHWGMFSRHGDERVQEIVKNLSVRFPFIELQEVNDLLWSLSKEEGCKEATDTAVADCVIGFLVYNHWPVLTADEAAALDW